MRAGKNPSPLRIHLSLPSQMRIQYSGGKPHTILKSPLHQVPDPIFKPHFPLRNIQPVTAAARRVSRGPLLHRPKLSIPKNHTRGTPSIFVRLPSSWFLTFAEHPFPWMPVVAEEPYVITQFPHPLPDFWTPLFISLGS